MGGGNAQKAKMARERNLEKQKNGSKGSQLEANKKAMSIQESRAIAVQGMHANLYMHNIGSEVQGTYGSKTSQI